MSAPEAGRGEVRVERVDISSEVAQTLIAALSAELRQRYPEVGMRHFRLDAEEVAPGRGAFVVAYLEGGPPAAGRCAGWRAPRPRSSACTRRRKRADAA